MALFVDNQTANNNTLKHFCRICKKGFGCGRALGGHMRAHGIGGEDSGGHHIDDNDDEDEEEEEEEDDDDETGTPNSTANRRMYALRANPRSCRACEHCGKEFSSWKSFLEHGKCVSDESPAAADSLLSDSGDDPSPAAAGNWSKRKRSFRGKATTEDEDLANCLMMLSNAAVEPEESCASASRDNDLIVDHHRTQTHFNVSPISFRVPESTITTTTANKAKGIINNVGVANNSNNNNNKGLFECKACKKVFNSHQALGGHRASHKKVKGCFAARLDQTLTDAAEPEAEPIHHHSQFFPANKPANDPAVISFDSPANNNNNKRKSKVHECSICHRIFSSGQALGGHKRCHWITSNSGAAVVGPGAEASAALAKFHESIEQINLAAVAAAAAAAAHQHHHSAAASGLDLKLDLNLPVDDDNNADAPTEIYFQPWMVGSSSGAKQEEEYRDGDEAMDDKEGDQCNEKNNNVATTATTTASTAVIEDEADSKVKLAKLSELKDINASEGSSPWLQVGIGSTTDVGSTVP